MRLLAWVAYVLCVTIFLTLDAVPRVLKFYRFWNIYVICTMHNCRDGADAALVVHSELAQYYIKYQDIWS